MGFFRTFGSHLGAGLAAAILDRIDPPPPSIVRQVLDEAPKVIGFVMMLANTAREIAAPCAFPDPLIKPPAGLRVEPDFPPFKKLGQFTCPKCGGHTWSWTGVNGVDENGTHIRMCSGHHDPIMPRWAELKEGVRAGDQCGFTWKATDDAKYFSSVEVGPAPESAMAPPHDVNGLRGLSSLVEVVGIRRNDGESTSSAAARLLREADDFIAKQAAEIARQNDVIKGYKFPVGGGEIQVSESEAVILCLGEWTLRVDDGKRVVSSQISSKDVAVHLSRLTGTLFEAHAIGSPMGRMAEYAKESAERSAIRNAIATSDTEVSCADYVERQTPRYNRAEIVMEQSSCGSCGAERGRKCAADCANEERLKAKP